MKDFDTTVLLFVVSRMNVIIPSGGGGGGGHPTVHSSVDICSEGVDRLRNSDLVVFCGEQICRSLKTRKKITGYHSHSL